MKSLRNYIAESTNNTISYTTYDYLPANLIRGRASSSVDSWVISDMDKTSAIVHLSDKIKRFQSSLEQAKSEASSSDGSAETARAKDDVKTYKKIVQLLTKELRRVNKL